MPPDGGAEETGRMDCSKLLPLACLLLAGAGLPEWAAGAPPQAVDPRRYVIADALFLQRNNATQEQPIVVNATNTNLPVVTANGLNAQIGTGARLFYGDYGSDGLGWELGYTGVYGMDVNRWFESDADILQAGGQPGFAEATGLIDGERADVSYRSQINSIEANTVFHSFDGGPDRRSPYPWQRSPGYDGGHVDWLLGVRWAGLEEAAQLAITPGGYPTANTYDVQTSSNLFAAQVGTRGRWAWQNWAFEGWMKIGIAGSVLSQSQSMFDQLTPQPYRGPRSSDDLGMGMIADMNASLIYRLTDTWGLRIGYNLFWLTGVALAPDSWDFAANDGPDAGTEIRSTGSVFLNGANVGLEARW